MNLEYVTFQSQYEEAVQAIRDGDKEYAAAVLTPIASAFPPAAHMLARIYYARKEFALAEEYAYSVLNSMEHNGDGIMADCLTILIDIYKDKEDFRNMEITSERKIGILRDGDFEERMYDLSEAYCSLADSLIAQEKTEAAKKAMEEGISFMLGLSNEEYHSFCLKPVFEKYYTLCESVEQMEEYVVHTATLLKKEADRLLCNGAMAEAGEKYGRAVGFIMESEEIPGIHMWVFTKLIVDCRIAQSMIYEADDAAYALELIDDTYRLVLLKIWIDTNDNLEALMDLNIRLGDLLVLNDKKEIQGIDLRDTCYDTAINLAKLLNEREGYENRFDALIPELQKKLDGIRG